MRFKTILALFLCVTLVVTSSVPVSLKAQTTVEEKENEEGMDPRVRGDDRKNNEDDMWSPQNERQRILKEFKDLVEKVQHISEAKHISNVEYQEYLYYAKNKAEFILNSPRLEWNQTSLEFRVSEFQDVLTKDIKIFPAISLENRVFLQKESIHDVSFLLSEKESVFQSYDELLRVFKKNQIKFHWKGEKDTRLWRSYHLRLTSFGKKDFDQFISAALYHLLPSSDQKEFEVISKLSETMNLEMEALSELNTQAAFKLLVKRTILNTYVEMWMMMESMWDNKRFPLDSPLPLLPVSCQNQYFTLPPTTILELLKEEKQIFSDKVLFFSQFFTKLRADKTSLPIMMTEDLSKQLVQIVPQWKSEYEMLLNQDQMLAQRLISSVTETIQNMDNQFTRFILTWIFQYQNWSKETSQEEIKKIIETSLRTSKKILFLSIMERFIVEAGHVISDHIKEKLLVFSNQILLAMDADIQKARDHLFQLYKEAKEETKEVEAVFFHLEKNPENLKNKMGKLLEAAQKIAEQDQKMTLLSNGKSLPPIEDTPENFVRASFVLGLEWLQTQKKEVSPETIQELQNILFDVPETHSSASQRFETWFPHFQGDEKVEKEVLEIIDFFNLGKPFSEVMKPVERRQVYEKLLRNKYLGAFPSHLLETTVTYQGNKEPLYLQLTKAKERKASQEELWDFVQRAVWDRKHEMEQELDRFCKTDVNTPEGLKYFLTLEKPAQDILAKFSQFEELNRQIAQEFEKETTEGSFHHAIGTGFLTIITLSFVAGPLSRLPWWMGGRWVPFVPHKVLKLSHWFGMAAAPIALYWMTKDIKRLAFDEGKYIEALENYQMLTALEFNREPTFLDFLKAMKDIEKNMSQRIPGIYTSRTELWVEQGSFVIMFPIQYAFARGMLSQLYRYGTQDFALMRRIGLDNALHKLYIPTRFWTFKPANEFFALSNRKLKQAYRDAVDKVLSPKKMVNYIEATLKILKRDLFSARKLPQQEVLTIQIRLLEEALHLIKANPQKLLGQLQFRPAFVKAIEELELLFNRNLSALCPKDGLGWLMMTIGGNSHRFWNHWFGGWIGWQGSLGKSLEKFAAYHYLAEQKRSLLFWQILARLR